MQFGIIGLDRRFEHLRDRENYFELSETHFSRMIVHEHDPDRQMQIEIEEPMEYREMLNRWKSWRHLLFS